MSYLVMECHPGYAVLLDEEGRFLKAANLRYEIGQTVYDPVLMKDTPEKQRHTIRWISSGIAAIAACFLLLFGFSYYQNYMRPYSSIYLTINPEVQMDLNRQGTVVELTGTNEDGETLLEGYDGKGKDKVTVVDELLDRAIEMGFLSDGGRVSFSVDSPDETLFQEYGTELRTKVTEHLDGRITITIEIVDYKNGQSQEEPEKILDSPWIQNLLARKHIDELDRETIVEFIEQIEVGEKNENHEQKITIHYLFSDELKDLFQIFYKDGGKNT